jgi:hypothetical protein
MSYDKDDFIDRTPPPPKYQHSFEWSNREMRMMVGRYLGGGSWERIPYKVDDALGLAAEFHLAFHRMLKVYGRKNWRFFSGIGITGFKRDSEKRATVTVDILSSQIDRTFKAAQLKPLARFLADFMDDVYGKENWRR